MVSLPPDSAGAVLGVGVDLVDVARIRDVHTRQGERFLTKVYTEQERVYCLAQTNPYPSLAARFAAKEAVAKALGTGFGAEVGWRSVGVVHGDRGEPRVILDAPAQAWLESLGGREVLVSLSHTETQAMAFAVAVKGKRYE